MKNNIKYAGIAAAALLTVAPIAAPIVNSTTNVQTAQAATVDSNVTTVLNQFFNSSLNNSKTYSVKDAFPSFSDIASNWGTEEGASKAKTDLSYTDLMNLAPMSDLNNANLTLSSDAINTLKEAGVTFGVTGVDSNGKPMLKQNFTREATQNGKNGGTSYLQVTAYKDGKAIDGQSKSYAFIKNTDVDEGVTQLGVNFENPLDVDLNSSTTTPLLTTSVDANITDQKGNDVKITKVNPSAQIYTKSKDALDNTNQNTFTGKTFDQDGATYYQAVELTVDSAVNVQKIFDSMQAQNGGSITLNGTPAVKANLSQFNGNTIRFVREINVGKTTTTPDNGEWVETDNKGVVTVKTSPLAKLYDDDNKITNRSVANNSGWQTDKYRTNSKTGVVQYRVSTHEWVNASDVDFTSNEVTGYGLGNFNDIGDHVVSLDGPDGFVYTLFTAAGKQASRGLGGNTAWYTNRTANDAAGNTYYRVSTDEWVRAGNGVNFK
ncbi:hypothetical protein [Companilactobacillus ginsenosidimutans]|uniref:Surface layer protein A domain-containing protein n=1 Tax=Companilactobacillus ginsenosidimutans TaxID=1007676 RepID=A0A0H4QH26_9LACO|nr:hypothetical protein [Companilactobacillus ginsenosidimutans]AKP67247.1 hypothetical protein ABM34_06640 [Companilactobacillus ginsenosidimutans]